MFEAIVTFVTLDESGNTITKVYRVEFDSSAAFGDWMDVARTEGDQRVLDVNQLYSREQEN